MQNVYYKNVFYIICLIVYGFSASAQKPISKYFNIKDGLPSSEVYHTLQDSKGYLWFATDNGVSRYNGYEFQNFDLKSGLPDNVIFYMYEDFKKRIWFISYSCQLSYFQNDSIHQYEYNNLLADTVLNKTWITNTSFYLDSMGTVFFGTLGQGAFSIDINGKLKNTNRKERICIEIGDEGITSSFSKEGENILTVKDRNKKHIIPEYNYLGWGGRLISFKLNDKQLLFSDGRKVSIIENGHIIRKYIFKNNIAWLGKDIDSNLWISEYNKGVKCFIKSNLDSKPIHYLSGETVTKVLIAKNKSTWFSTLNGVYSMSSLKIKNIVEGKKIYQIEEGRKSEIWFSTFKDVVYNYNYKNNKLKYYQDKRSGTVEALRYEPKHNKLFYGGSNLFGVISNNKRSDTDLGMTYPFKQRKKIGLYFKQIIKKNDTLSWYVGYHIGLINHITNTLSEFPSTLKLFKSSRPLSIHYLNDSILYIGTKEGLWQYDFKDFKQIKKNNSLLHGKIVDISSDHQENLWVASKGNGIMYMFKDSVYHISEKDGLSSNSVNTLFVDSNIVWVGTMNGLNKITINDFRQGDFSIERIFQYHGLASNNINDVLVNEGTVYVGTDEGLTYFKSSDLSLNQDSVSVYITDISISEKDTMLLDSYHLDHLQNTISIQYIGLNFRNGDDTKYRYRLIGAENKWNETTQRIVRYPMLPPGEYKFELTAMNDNGIWNQSSKTVDFIIDLPYTQTWGFYVMMFLMPLILIALILFIIYNIKIKESDKRLVLYENVAVLRQKALAQQMNPHFIFNTLSSIQYYINENDKKASNKYLTMFARLMRLTLNNSYEKSIPISEELEALEIYIKLEQLRFSDRFFYEINISSNINPQDYLMPSLLLQPFVENSIWHGIMHRPYKNGNIMISLEKIKDEILFTVIDNGIGRKKSAEINLKSNKTHQSLGAKITESRLKLINTSKSDKLVVNYSDLYDEKGGSSGTKVRIRLPLVKNNIPESN